MTKLHVVKPKHSLLYSMRLLKNIDLSEWKHEHIEIPGPDDKPLTFTIHSISGTREEIKQQLLQSIDAFFDLADEEVL